MPEQQAFGMELSALWCGQGMANVLTTYTKTEWLKPDRKDRKPLSVVLIDFGTEAKSGIPMTGRKYKRTKTAVQFVEDALKRKGIKQIDLVIASHADADHWFLLDPLLRLLGSDDARGTLAKAKFIKKMIFGGFKDDWSKPESPTFRRLIKYVRSGSAEHEYLGGIGEKRITKLATCYTGYKYKAGKKPQSLPVLANINGVNLRALVANVPEVGGAGPNSSINTSSLVVVADFKNQRIVLTGDATWPTLSEADKILKEWPNPKLLQPVQMMTVPHHGTRVTMVQTSVVAGSGGPGLAATHGGSGRESSKKRKMGKEAESSTKKPSKRSMEEQEHFSALKAFQALTQPRAIIASAEWGVGQTGHPHKELLEILGVNTQHGEYAGVGPFKDNIGDHKIVCVVKKNITKNVFKEFIISGANASNTFTNRLITDGQSLFWDGTKLISANVADYHYRISEKSCVQSWEPKVAEALPELSTRQTVIAAGPWESGAAAQGITPMEGVAQQDPAAKKRTGGKGKKKVVPAPPHKPFPQVLDRQPVLNPVAARLRPRSEALSTALPPLRVRPNRENAS